MSELANKALRKLFERGERASLKEASRAITLSFTQVSFPLYLAASFSEKQESHGALRNAQRCGSIEIDWDPRAGENGQIVRIVLKDLSRLAEHLRIKTHAQLMSEARELLSPWAARARVQEILNTWSELRPVRGRHVEEASDLADALRVLDHCSETRDTSVRLLSAALFNSSKRLEQLEPWLDLLTSEQLQGPRRPAEEVFAGLGLVKHPPAVHLAGAAKLRLINDFRLDVPVPFIALAPRSVLEIEIDTSVHTVLSVENLTIFHEIAEGRAGSLTGYLLLYTAGMPAPSFIRLYAKLLASCGQRQIFHWGDIDPAGFRIAACLARVAERSGHNLKLWQMCANEYSRERAWRQLDEREQTEIRRLCELHGWTEEAQSVQMTSSSFEQESLPLILPNM